MSWKTPEDAMPWVGLYVAIASLVCTLAMAADAFHGFRQGKLWFPCKLFTLNAASLTVIAVAMKMPVDLTTINKYSIDQDAKNTSIIFLFTMLANFLPSLGLMGDKELLVNMIALSILLITILVNVCIQMVTKWYFFGELNSEFDLLQILATVTVFSVALTVPESRRIFELQYKELHGLSLNHKEIHFSYKELVHNVKKYWVMAETSNPQFVIACSQVSSALGVVCLYLAGLSAISLGMRNRTYYAVLGESDYKWSIKVIDYLQYIGITVGGIAPGFRCLSLISHFNLSKKWSTNHINVFRVEKQWIQILQKWKRTHVRSNIPGRHSKMVFHRFKNLILNVCIVLQILAAVTCKTVCLIPRCFLIIFSYCWHLCKLLLKTCNRKPNALNDNMNSEVEEYRKYVLLFDEEAVLSKRVLTNILKSITKLLQESEKKEPRNLMKLLKKSTNFNGVVEFDNERVPLLHGDNAHNCWSLVLVTLTAVAIALPNVANTRVMELLSGMREGLKIVKRIEENLNENCDLVEARKASKRLWTEVEVYFKWLQIDLKNKAYKGKTSKEILRLLGDVAVQNVIQFKSRESRSLNRSFHKFIASSSMYRISETIQLHCNKQENWPNDEQLFDWISTVIADLLCACFTNIPRVVTMMCHHDAIEKREHSIRAAAKLLGKSKNILSVLEKRQLSNMDVDSMAYIDKWHALPNSELINGCASSNHVQPASASTNGSLIVTVM
ncbi:uncharacterized protein [Rutidosis leptorrhynchoides]|uniref:uncharacterized protein n=1 Tax=Rutidosis leptorrhynchoides TaxID=125765 RepID=UPI003A99EBF1